MHITLFLKRTPSQKMLSLRLTMTKIIYEELFFSKTMDFLNVFLIKQQNRSPKTAKAYQSSLREFYLFVTTKKDFKSDTFRFIDCTYNLILDFSQYLQEKKNYKPSSVNARIAAIKSYLEYVADGDIKLMQIYLSIKRVPNLKVPRLIRPILEKDELKLLLASPSNTLKGNRDKVLLILLFDTAIRVAEICNIEISDISLNVTAPHILIRGKGRKERDVYLSKNTIEHLKWYIDNYHDPNEEPNTPLFYTKAHGVVNHMTERNVERIVKKYADIVRKTNPNIPDTVYPHMFRRSRATGMHRDNIPDTQIATILGHSSLNTTKRYAIPSPEQLRDAITSSSDVTDPKESLWINNEDEIMKKFGLK